jgi:hypothetical protein
VQLAATREIARPAAEVFAFLADASNNPRWQRGMVSCEWTSPRPIDIGSTYRQTARFMGRTIRSTFAVTEFEPGRRIRIETIESTFPIQVTRSVTPLGESSCRVSAEITGGPQGWMRSLSGLMARRAQKSVDADYDRLVGLLEGDPGEE